MVRLLFTLTTLVLLTVPAAAQDFESGFDAYKNGEHAKALEVWRPLARQGQPKAQTFLGDMYANGFGVSTDETSAAKWYRKAAEQGASRAQVRLAFMYYQGRGVPEDYVLAHKWFNLAAAQGENGAAAIRDKRLEPRMTAQQIAQAQKLAREWMEKNGK